MRFSMKKCALGVAAAFAIGAGPSVANAANISIWVDQDGSGVIQLVNNVPSPLVGSYNFSGSSGVFTNISVSAYLNPVLTAPDLFNTTTLDITASNLTTNHTLKIWVASLHNSSPVPAAGVLNFTSGFGVTAKGPVGWTVDEQTFLNKNDTVAAGAFDPTIGAVALSPVQSFAADVGGSSSAFASIGGIANTYAAIEQYTVSVTPLGGHSGSVSGGINLAAAVPEPETYAMMLAGLGLMGFIARRRKKMAVA